jgi:hypothetical protein
LICDKLMSNMISDDTVTRRVPLVEQELPTLPEHRVHRRFISGVCVVRSLVFCVVVYRSLFVILTIVPSHCGNQVIVATKSLWQPSHCGNQVIVATIKLYKFARLSFTSNSLS